MNNKGEFFKVQFFLSGLWRRGKRCVLQLITLLLLLGCVQAAFATPTTPTGDFIDNKDGTVTHKTTGLTWMRCAMGQTWTGSTCSGTASTYTYEQAVALISTFAGQSDWRLPNIAELQTLVERENSYPAINTSLFPNAPSDWFWSSSPNVGFTLNAWIVDFYNGFIVNYDRNNSLPVRLVRSSQSLGIGLSSLDTEFTDNQDGTVTHKRTGLVWQRCSVGQAWTGSSCSGNADYYTYDAAMTLTSGFAGRSDWRVPTANELASIVKYDTYGPAINTTLFPSTPSDKFWSSSPSVGFTSYAWYVYFGDGVVSVSNRSNSLPVRLVRTSQSLVIGSSIITDVTPKTSILGSPTVFTVTGTNLTTGMGFTVGDCALSNKELTGGTATKRQFLCTQYGVAGDKVGLVKTAPGGTRLFNFTVQAKPDNIPEVYAATDKKILSSSNDIVSILLSTTVQNRLNTAVLYDLYAKFTLPDGSVVYDDGTQIVSEKTPFSSGLTITQASDWSDLLQYSLASNAPSGTYIATIGLWKKNAKIALSTSTTVFDYFPPIAAPTLKSATSKSEKLDWLIKRGSGVWQGQSLHAMKSSASSTPIDPNKLVEFYKSICDEIQGFPDSDVCKSQTKKVMALQMGTKYFEKLGGVEGFKGAYGIFKKGETLMGHLNKIDAIFNDYWLYKNNINLVGDQSTLLFGMKLVDKLLAGEMTSFVTTSDLADRLVVVFENWNKHDAVLANEAANTNGWSKIDVVDHCLLGCDIKQFELTPIFTYNGGSLELPIKDWSKTYTTAATLKSLTQTKNARESSFGPSDYIFYTLNFGLYMATVRYSDGEVYRQPVYINKHNDKYEVTTEHQ